MLRPILLFPGQSSRTATMLTEAAELDPALTTPLLEEAKRRSGSIIDQLLNERRDAPFSSNLEVQVGVFLANHLRLAILTQAGIDADVSLGLSLGEYNHLVHIGALSFGDALELVAERGRAYDAGPSGAMAAVFPLPIEELEGLVEKAKQDGLVEIVNFNSPTQHVVAGEHAAIDTLIALVEEETFAATRIIEQRIPMHSSRFAPVANSLRLVLDAAPWRSPVRPYLANVEARFIDNPQPSDFADLLARHVHQPVRWKESVDLAVGFVSERGDTPILVEVGPSTVLHDMLSRRWRDEPRRHTATPDAIRATVAALGDQR